MTLNLHPLDKKLRNKLERTVKETRDVAEEGARAACRQLGVGRAKPDDHLTDEEKDLRRRLRILGRQFGDKRDPKKETQELDRLVDETAYEHWRRILFARFASRMLPRILRLESPVFSLDLPPENLQQFERLLSDLPEEVFVASDSLGWVCQF